ncbi:hypothetical protein IPJ72_03995 [Candidatus Peregrinibacteria bacterium]|nr:MAG: hypothetical protein IPJ72_03995 [Candidatus Peregrinibacteria bacterium]
MKTHCSLEVLKKIKDTQLKPRPRWQFLFLHSALWVLFIVTILIGSVSFSVILRTLDQTYYATLYRIGHHSLQAFLLLIPYLWFVLLALMLFLARALFCKTKTGYRHGPLKIILSSVFLSAVMGLGLHSIGTSQLVEQQLNDHVKPYAQWQQMKDRALVDPKNGLLVGRIVQITPEQSVMVVDFRNMTWTVQIDHTMYFDSFVPAINAHAIMLGEMLDEQRFRADRMMEWRKHPKK